jgi:sucrose-6-phosphate hydrolase SacC (GH32 family)
MKQFVIASFMVLIACSNLHAQNDSAITHPAPAPMFRDPITDGAADPVVFYNREEKSWWMLYTQRRANAETADVAYCYGNPIGIASSDDHGRTWVYRGTLDLKIDKGLNTFWAPDIAYQNGTYHLYVTYIVGARTHWGGQAHLAHFTSKDLWSWKFEDFPKLTSDDVIDPTLFQMPDKSWRMWYKDSRNPEGNMLMATSKDLKSWKTNNKPIFPGNQQEGPKVFKYGEYYWLLTDEWHGMRVYRSKDLDHWEKQGLVLNAPGKRFDDTPEGAHGDVVVVDNKAYVIYFTHPGRKKHTEAEINKATGIYPFELRRSSISVAQLEFKDGTLVCDRDKPFDFYLPDIK